ncbi:RNA binding motif protein 12Bb [Syngnathoides biaculeatus]|uniref:RNA binding motif protein 12Bb n=1 Tax=Syngnathoides biaculeatus TaxID=300417 RepID=UPI002ADE1AFC|nr:RNA binding motif protein 12Bb [Syngnathoides biaculeatus]
MAVVIRLQGLRITAGSQDVRKFFTGLKIPDGGVHIIGGEQEEAFIIFASDEDARRAMTRSGGQIKGSPVTLLLSSKAEMQGILEKSAINAEPDQESHIEDNARHPRRSLEAETNKRSASRADISPPPRQKRHTNEDSMCVFLKGLPFNVSEREICEFFNGLRIADMILLKNATGKNNGMGLVRFSSTAEVSEALKRDRGYIGSRYVEICPTSEEDWRRTTGRHPMNPDPGNNPFERHGSPPRGQKNFPHRMRSQSPPGQRVSPSSAEHCVLVENISFAVQKEDMKRLFHHAALDDDQILFLNHDDRKTKSAFVLFRSHREYRKALEMDAQSFFYRMLLIRPIMREKMIAMLKSQNMNVGPSGNSRMNYDRPPSHPMDNHDPEQCLLVQNLPPDVRKVEVQDFFFGLNIWEDDVHLLQDNTGAGTGKALVLFPSESAAMRALALDGQRFLGAVVSLRCISRAQMRELIAGPQAVHGPQQRSSEFQGAGDREYYGFKGSYGGENATNMGPQMSGGYNSYEDPLDRGNGAHGSGGPPRQHLRGPTCVKFVNLPFQIKTEEIYDFCHGYRIIPGSISLQYDRSGAFKGTATVVFETRQEAVIAVEELNGRPIGARKIQLLFV